MENNIKISQAGILLNGVIHCGKRHDQIIKNMVQMGYPTPIRGVQGFVDEAMNFYTRSEAREICLQNGQLKNPISRILTSEDLW